MAEVLDTIKEYLTVTNEQVFYIIDFLIKSKLVIFEDGKLIITYEGYSILRNSKLDGFSLQRINEFKYVVKETPLKNYIPKKL
ncbi:hypothetical protein MKX66_15150 [Bacillus sp. FSL R9-9530]|uniref:hypothetical protein n=1 Tax=Bacillus TaxID=1386 RepID=UPI0030F86B08